MWPAVTLTCFLEVQAST